MRGYHNSDPGLIPLSIQQVFDYINSDKERNYTISVSYLEVRNDISVLFNGLFKILGFNQLYYDLLIKWFIDIQ